MAHNSTANALQLCKFTLEKSIWQQQRITHKTNRRGKQDKKRLWQAFVITLPRIKEAGMFNEPITYAFNWKVQRCTKTTLISLVLSQHSTGPASFDDNFSFFLDRYYPTQPQTKRAQLFTSVNDLRAQVDTTLAWTRNRYTCDHDKHVKRTAVLELGHLVNANKPPPAAASVKVVVKIATNIYEKFLPKENRHFPNIKVSNETIVIEDNRLRNTISTPIATLTSGEDTKSISFLESSLYSQNWCPEPGFDHIPTE